MLARPVLAPLLENRAASLALVGAAGAHLLLVALGLPSFVCPIRAATGVPCPGCGLSRAVGALAHGDLRTTLALHAFAPALVLLMTVVAIISILPATTRLAAVRAIELVERRAFVIIIGLLMLMAYWVARVLWFGFPPELFG